eukprot:678765-Pelagomonas_calceolata.AAC.1
MALPIHPKLAYDPNLDQTVPIIDEQRFSTVQNTGLSDLGGSSEAVNATRKHSLRNDSVSGESEGYPGAVQVKDALDLVRRGYKEDATFNSKAFLEKQNWYLVIQAYGLHRMSA